MAPASDTWCNTLVNFFQDKISHIQDTFSLPPGQTLSALAKSVVLNSAYSFSTFSFVDLDSSLKLLKSLKSGSPSDPCAARLLAEAADTINPEVNCLINMSLQEACVPESWKQALIFTLLKKTVLDPLVPANYRPISLLPSLSKVCEKTVTTQLTNYVEASGLLHTAQSGFRATYSTESALLEVVESIRDRLDAGGKAALVLLDLSAVFDTVPHSLLLARLYDIGISGSVLLWIKSFLAGRSQRVWLPPCTSDSVSVTTGVPQGSSLSPILFNIYMTPLVYLAESLGAKVMAYADDTQLPFLWNRGEESVAAAQHCLSSVFQWLANAQLKCNEGKSEVLLFGSFGADFRERTWPPDSPRPSSVGNTTKNIGVWFDENLQFKTHVKKLAGTCYSILKTLRKFLPLLPREARETWSAR